MLTDKPTESEISYFVYLFAFHFFLNQYILWFDISMNDDPIPETTHHVLEPIDQLFQHVQYLISWYILPLLNYILECAIITIFHHNI